MSDNIIQLNEDLIKHGLRDLVRSGHYKRNFQTTAGEVELNVPKLKGVPFETAIIERYRRRESSVEEALIEMYQQKSFSNIGKSKIGGLCSLI